MAWSLKERATAPTVLSLSQDPANLTNTSILTERHGGRGVSTRTVHEGDRIIITGEPSVCVSTSSVIPRGTVDTFVDGSKVSSTTLSSDGTASVTLTVPPAGNHTVSVRYPGSSTVALSKG